MARYHVRCRKCEARRVLVKLPDEYERLPKCRSCGAQNYRLDKWMNNRPTGLRGQGCNCSGYWFIHRRGSLYCWYRPDGTDRLPGDDDFKDRNYDDV